MKRLALAIAIAGCATPAVTPTAPTMKVIALTPSQDRCEAIVAVMCYHDAGCGVRPVVECMAIVAGVCADATGISSAEADACVLDVADSTCGSGIPDGCYGIMDDDDAVQGSPDVKGAVTL